MKRAKISGILDEISDIFFYIRRCQTADEDVCNVEFRVCHENSEGFYDLYFDNVRFTNCVFSKCNFKCTFNNCIFENCDLSGSDFSQCRFYSCDFIKTKAVGCDFSRIFPSNVYINGCSFRYSNFSEDKFDGLSLVDSNFDETFFSSSSFKNAVFTDISFSGTEFFRTPLKGIDFTLCRTSGIKVSSDMSELKGAVFTEYQALELSSLLGIIIK